MFDGRAWCDVEDGEKVVSPERAGAAGLVAGAIAQEYGLLSGGFERGALEDNGGVNGASESGPPFSGDDALRGGVTEGEDRQG